MRPDRPSMPRSYGIKPLDEGRIIDWSWVVSQLMNARNYWVVTASLTGYPHANPVWGIWHDDHFYFSTDLRSRKGMDLTANHRAVVHLESGDDVVIVEGLASLVPPQSLSDRIKINYSKKYGVRLAGGRSSGSGQPRSWLGRKTTSQKVQLDGSSILDRKNQ